MQMKENREKKNQERKKKLNLKPINYFYMLLRTYLTYFSFSM